MPIRLSPEEQSFFGQQPGVRQRSMGLELSEEEQQFFGMAPARRRERPGFFSEVGEGLERGLYSTGALISGAAGQVGRVLGADDFSDSAMETYDELMREAEASPAAISSVEDIRGMGDFMLWTAGVLGENLPTIASVIASGGLGSLVAGVGLKAGSQGLAKEALKRGMAKGFAGGAFTGSTALGTGEVAGELREAGTEDPGLALGFGTAIGALDALPILGVAKQFGLGGRLKSEFARNLAALSRPKQVAVMAPMIGGAEAGTEALQELLVMSARKLVDENYEILGEEGRSRLLNAAAGGFVVGGTFGGAGTAIAGVQAEGDEVAPFGGGLSSLATELDLGPPVQAPEKQVRKRRQKRKAKPKEPVPIAPIDPQTVEDLSPPEEVTGKPDAAPISREAQVTEEGAVVEPLRAEQPGVASGSSTWVDEVLAVAEADGRDVTQPIPRKRESNVLSAKERERLERLRAKTSDEITEKEKQVRERLEEKAGRSVTVEDPVGFYAEDERGTLYGPFKSAGEALVFSREMEGPGDTIAMEVGTPAEFQELVDEGWIIQPVEDAEALVEAMGRDLGEVRERAKEGKVRRAMGKEPIRRTAEERLQFGFEVVEEVERFRQRYPLAPQIRVMRPAGPTKAEEFGIGGPREVAVGPVVEENLLESSALHVSYPSGEREVVLNLDRLGDRRQVQKALAHEVLVHEGIRKFLTPTQREGLLRMVERDLDLGYIAANYKHIDVMSDEGRLSLAEEYIAKLAEEEGASNPTLWEKVKNFLKRVLRPFFPEYVGTITDEELRGVVREMDRAFRGRRFNKSLAANYDIAFATTESASKDKQLRELMTGTWFMKEGVPQRIYGAENGEYSLVPTGVETEIPMYASVRKGKMLDIDSDLGAKAFRQTKRALDKSGRPAEPEDVFNALWAKGVEGVKLGDKVWLSPQVRVVKGWGDYGDLTTGDFYGGGTARVEKVLRSMWDDSDVSAEGKQAIENIGKLQNLWKVRFMRWFMTPLQIGQMVPLQSVQDYLARTEAFWNTKMSMITEADAVVTEWRQLGKERANRLSKTLFEANQESETLNRRLSERELALIFESNGLNQEDIELYGRIDKSFRDIQRRVEISALRTTLRETLRRRPSPELETKVLELYDSGATAPDMAVELEKLLGLDSEATVPLALRLEQNRDQVNKLKIRNYFPHMRFGPYSLVVVAKQDMVFEGKKFKKGKLLVFETTENAKDQQTRKSELEKELGAGVRVIAGKLEDNELSLLGFPPMLFESMKKELKLSETQQRVLEEIYVRYSPGKRFLKSLTKRKGIAGYSQDAMRVYAAYMMNAANHVARIEHKDDLQEAISRMSSLSKGKDPGAGPDENIDLPVTQLTGMGELRNYFGQHYNYLMNPGNDFAHIRAVGFMWYLGASPKSAFVNLTQVPMVTYPFLAARYGDVRTVREISKAYRDVTSMFRKNGGNVDSLEREMLSRGVEEGWIDESLATELAGIAEAPALFRMLPGDTGSRLMNQVSYYGAWMFHQAEKYNRRVAALSAFRLEMARSGDSVRAHAAAKNSVQATQFEYAKWNRAAFMRGKSSVFFLFWQYMQQASFLAFGGEGRGTAIRMWSLLFFMAGAQGLPFAENAMDLFDFIAKKFKGMFGFKDPHSDVRTDLRELVQELGVNPDIAMHGLSRYYGLGPLHLMEAFGAPIPNTDVSGSLSMGRVIPGMEDLLGGGRDADKQLARMLVEAGGPVVGIGYNFWRLAMEDHPDQWKQWERALPTVMKNVSKFLRYTERGEETLSTGATIYDFGDLPSRAEEVAAKLAQAAGFAPTGLGQAYERRGAQEGLRRYWLTRRALAMQNFGYAHLIGDREGRADARDSITEYNKSVPTPLLRITRDELIQSLKGRMRRADLAEMGLPNEKRLRSLYRQIGEAYPGVTN